MSMINIGNSNILSSELPSWDVIVPAMLKNGIMKLRESCKLRPGVPLKPMLANPTKAITEVLDRFENQTFTCEFKYDGERAQIHYVAKEHQDKYIDGVPGATQEAAKGIASVFSRNSEDLSKKYPDILAKLHTWVKEGTKSFVMDCESVAWDVAEKKVLPFQQLMTRKKKDVKIEDVKVKVCVFAFDLLFLNGEALVEKSLRERRELMYESFNPVEGEFAFATSMDGQEIEQIQTFLEESIKASCEGLMVKMLDGTESGYEPSKRSRNWLKVRFLPAHAMHRHLITNLHHRSKRTTLLASATRLILSFWARTMARASELRSTEPSYWLVTTRQATLMRQSAILAPASRSRCWRSSTRRCRRLSSTAQSPSTRTHRAVSISPTSGLSPAMSGKSRLQT